MTVPLVLMVQRQLIEYLQIYIWHKVLSVIPIKFIFLKKFCPQGSAETVSKHWLQGRVHLQAEAPVRRQRRRGVAEDVDRDETASRSVTEIGRHFFRGRLEGRRFLGHLQIFVNQYWRIYCVYLNMWTHVNPAGTRTHDILIWFTSYQKLQILAANICNLLIFHFRGFYVIDIVW
jgi:hypothetical protein